MPDTFSPAILRTREWLLDRQHPDGYWVAELEGDTILESQTILLLAFFGREDSPWARRLAQSLIDTQLPGGGWAMYPGGKVDVSGSVTAYFALKLTGHDPGAEYMQRARAAVLAAGGADAANSYTRFFLAMLGQIPYWLCPAVPPEVVLLPKWLPVNLYAVSAWSRTIIVPLSIVWAVQPVRQVAPELGIRELFLKAPSQWPPLRCPGLPGGTGLVSWDRFFRTADAVLKWCRRRGFTPLRRRALRAAERWTLDRFHGSDGLGAIYPPIIWSLLALHSLGYGQDRPEVRYCWQQLEDLTVEDEDSESCWLQPCKSPVWDTAIALRALVGGGLYTSHPAVRRAVKWLVDRQVTRPGDWSETVRAEPGGWCFEHRNDFYPDCDDTAMALMALQEQLAGAAAPETQPETPPPETPPPERRALSGRPTTTPLSPCGRGAGGEGAARENHEVIAARPLSDDSDPPRAADVDLGHRTTAAIHRGLEWLLAMQNHDGGWGAFDRNNNRQFLCHVPFADHNAMIDPSTPDLTGRVLEALAKLGRRLGDAAVDRAVAYLRRTQERDGSWFGRWGVNYVYGTWQVLTGLAAVGVRADDPAVAAGANWLLAHQQPCGAWGESADSYDDPSLCGQGPPTASQTAWAVLGLLAAGLEGHPAVLRGVQYLLEQQAPNGAWEEAQFTGTGFPRVFYLRYHYYAIYFPLMALSRFARSVSPSPVESEDAILPGASQAREVLAAGKPAG